MEKAKKAVAPEAQPEAPSTTAASVEDVGSEGLWSNAVATARETHPDNAVEMGKLAKRLYQSQKTKLVAAAPATKAARRKLRLNHSKWAKDSTAKSGSSDQSKQWLRDLMKDAKNIRRRVENASIPAASAGASAQPLDKGFLRHLLRDVHNARRRAIKEEPLAPEVRGGSSARRKTIKEEPSAPKVRGGPSNAAQVVVWDQIREMVVGPSRPVFWDEVRPVVMAAHEAKRKLNSENPVFTSSVFDDREEPALFGGDADKDDVTPQSERVELLDPEPSACEAVSKKPRRPKSKPEKWVVVWAGGMCVVREKNTNSEVLAEKDAGETLEGRAESGWLALTSEPGYVLLGLKDDRGIYRDQGDVLVVRASDIALVQDSVPASGDTPNQAISSQSGQDKIAKETNDERIAREWADDQEFFKTLPPLPEGWIRVRSRRTGVVYYYHVQTHESSLQMPSVPMVASVSSSSSFSEISQAVPEASSPAPPVAQEKSFHTSASDASSPPPPPKPTDQPHVAPSSSPHPQSSSSDLEEEVAPFEEGAKIFAFWPAEGEEEWLPATFVRGPCDGSVQVMWEDGSSSDLPADHVQSRSQVGDEAPCPGAGNACAAGLGDSNQLPVPGPATPPAEEVPKREDWRRLASKSQPNEYYYWDAVSGISTLEPPPPWKMCRSRSNPDAMYYWNPVTHETSLEKPPLGPASDANKIPARMAPAELESQDMVGNISAEMQE